MRRSGFSLIELIFVMLILGILIAVAVVKYSNMSDRARVAQLNAFTGTLNRTSGAGFWYKSIDSGDKGSVANVAYDDIIAQYIEIVPGYNYGPFLSKCAPIGDGVFLRYPLSKSYEIHCIDGSVIESPHFRLYNATEGIYLN